jgi:peptidoglycan/LPS O-acetylase OafA/YrhL
MNGNRPRALPRKFYLIAIALYAWGIAMAWIAFSGSGYESLVLPVATILFALVVGIIVSLLRLTPRRKRRREPGGDQPVDTYSGPLRKRAAAVQMLLPAIAVALGFTLLGFVDRLVIPHG